MIFVLRHYRALDLRTKRKKSTVFVRERSGTLFSSLPRPYPVFFLTCLQGKKIRVTAVIRLYMDDTLDEEGILMIFDQLEVQTQHCKSRSLGDDFSSKFRCRRGADEFPACVTCHGQLRMRTMTKQRNSCSSSFSFCELKLSVIVFDWT